MDYLPGDCSLNTLNTVYTQQIKPKNVSINSATTTFLYFWNKTANQTQYEYYLYKKSSYNRYGWTINGGWKKKKFKINFCLNEKL